MRDRPSAPDWTGCALVASGVGIFLATSPRSSGRSRAPVWEWPLPFGAVALVCAAPITVGKTGGKTILAGTLAAAAGVLFGLAAAVMLGFSWLLRDLGLTAILGHWQPWARGSALRAQMGSRLKRWRCASACAGPTPMMTTTFLSPDGNGRDRGHADL